LRTGKYVTTKHGVGVVALLLLLLLLLITLTAEMLIAATTKLGCCTCAGFPVTAGAGAAYTTRCGG
jgi:hypothetical protein